METEIKVAQSAAGISYLQDILDNNTPADEKTLQRCYMLRDFGALISPHKTKPGRPGSIEFAARFWKDSELVTSMKSWLENTNL